MQHRDILADVRISTATLCGHAILNLHLTIIRGSSGFTFFDAVKIYTDFQISVLYGRDFWFSECAKISSEFSDFSSVWA